MRKKPNEKEKRQMRRDMSPAKEFEERMLEVMGEVVEEAWDAGKSPSRHSQALAMFDALTSLHATAGYAASVGALDPSVRNYWEDPALMEVWKKMFDWAYKGNKAGG